MPDCGTPWLVRCPQVRERGGVGCWARPGAAVYRPHRPGAWGQVGDRQGAALVGVEAAGGFGHRRRLPSIHGLEAQVHQVCRS